ncbi:hypothetical protein PHSY_000525 [Pseudozyma hubeiensis SY62]|uniref:Uncharacterized protein n=1 Tax=Pseudozyma hubeiensis (strain SY62) TaxID=1305764 RepID=R9P4E9_PSEHS|nr:hypothetical protein PHSY_000525 [Pseudozyma hubeiensis SY62]GAC92965.1 hypothetical protein PHSY_000525 [Pseudozyma hubeiensis SY62]
MLSAAPSIGTRQCLRLRPRSSVGPTKRSAATALPTSPALLRHRVGLSAPAKLLHTTAAGAQAVEVVDRSHVITLPSTQASEELSDIAHRARSIANPESQILGPEWKDRVELLLSKVHNAQDSTARARVGSRVILVGSSLSQTKQLLTSMIDEPLRELGSSPISDTQPILDALDQCEKSAPLSIRYAPGPAQLLNDRSVTLDRHWLQHAHLEIAVLIDPVLSEATYDLIYDSEAVLFVTDDYALSRSAHRSRGLGERGDVTHELLARFAGKPNAHLVVNSILGSDPTQLANALEAATGASVSELVLPNTLSVRISDAIAANTSLRQALNKQQQEPVSPAPTNAPSTAYWDNFSSRYQRSNVASVIAIIQNLDSLSESEALAAQSAAFLLQHCIDEALATAKHNLACLYQLRSLASEAKEGENATIKQSIERIWPPATAFTGQLSSDEIKVWRPASPGSLSAVDHAMQETDNSIESTFDNKLQWWKLVWKVDDIRKELETACAGFAASLESDLAYESGRLATLQVEQVRAADQLLVRFRQLAENLSSSIASVPLDVALISNQAEAYRASELRTIEPSTLMEPIHRRRAQLLEAGGPIDVLASKSRKLAITSSAAVAVTAAGVGSASVLGSSLGLVDASSASLALDPATGLGLGLLTLTLVGWRMQGQYNKYRRRFRDDWQRFSKGLDQDLRHNLEKVLQQQITGSSNQVASSVASLVQKWNSQVQQHERHVRQIAANTARPRFAAASAADAVQGASVDKSLAP